MGSNRYKYQKDFWSKHKNEIIEQYTSGKTSNEIAQKYNCWGSTIINHLKEWGVNIRNNKENRYNNVFDTDIHFFDFIDSEEKVYLLGYILADGHITINGHLMFGCQCGDIDILYKVKELLKSDHIIRYNRDGNPILTICSKYLCDNLFKMGFTHNKSHEVDFKRIISFIPKELMHHFIRGMFDGDGSIRYYSYDYVKGFQYHFGYTGLYEVCDFVARYLNINTKIIKEHNEEETYTIRTANAPLIKYIYSILYKDATVYCERKRSTFDEVLKLIHQENKDCVKGVSWYKKSNQWMASCHMNKTNKTIGYYDTKHDAEYARLKYEYDNFGYKAPQFYFFKEYDIEGVNA